MMKVLSWNSGGLGHPSKSTALRDLISSKNPKILLLQETKQSEVDMQKITSKETLYEGTLLESRGASGGLASLWEKKKWQLKGNTVNSQ